MTTTRDRPAVLGGAPSCTEFPSWPVWDDDERSGLIETLDEGGWWQGDGSAASGFASDFAIFQGARYGLAFTNGTQTIEAALAACDIGEGDEVIVPGMTFVASASAVLAVNAMPVLVDVDPHSLCIDVAAAEAAITERTRAIVAVHVAGAAADLDALVAVCARHHLRLIEDCAHAHGTTWRGRGVGSWGDFGSFSMQRSKLMTAGEGGVLICSDPALRDRAWSYADCGRAPDEWFYHHPTYGSNMRMTEWQGAVLAAQLRRFPAQNELRNINALALNDALSAVPGLRPQQRDERMELQGNYCYVVHYDRDQFAGLALGDFEQALGAEGVPMGVSYPSLSELALFRTINLAPRLRTAVPPQDWSTLHLPVAEHASRSTVWMQHRLLLGSLDEVLAVADAAAKIQRHAAEIVDQLTAQTAGGIS